MSFVFSICVKLNTLEVIFIHIVFKIYASKVVILETNFVFTITVQKNNSYKHIYLQSLLFKYIHIL